MQIRTLVATDNSCASKAATHILTETIREELSEKAIKVIAVYMGYVNTQMVPEETKTQKSEPTDIVREICNGIEAGSSGLETYLSGAIPANYSKPLNSQTNITCPIPDNFTLKV
ncbi:SDR family NAD(P)-dependent oxidoreductase [Dyadobacter sp. NIV53]|uniref:SDR family NAD(P)-dependent oxidoreductase n=1 Tax=Dyadobacter sp. NIV53 TaxID=2861765 RepID=UPI001C871FB9|nr:SDR family NAD(P)-dependent oxidoreductase [Dyadobacter sp. NIV53]